MEDNFQKTPTGVELQIELLPCVNQAMVDNHVVVCNRCAIVNHTDDELNDVLVDVSGQFVKSAAVTVAQLHPKWTVQLSGLSVEFEHHALAQLEQPTTIHICFKAIIGDQLIVEQQQPVMLMPDNYWAGLQVMPSSLATMVLPRSVAAHTVLNAAQSQLQQLTQDPVFDDYQTLDPNRVRAQVAAIYQALQQLHITSLPLGDNLSAYNNHVRTPNQVLEQRMGNCLEVALFMASCLEACHLNPLLIFMRSQVLVGVWLVDSYCINPVSDDSSFLVKAANEDVANMVLLDVMACAESQSVTFDQAAQRAVLLLRDTKQEFNCFVDIKSCRLQNVKPSAVLTDAECVSGAGEEKADIQQEIKQVTLPEVTGTNIPEITKQQIWERKLLDFSMRNNLLNMRIGKRVLPFISFAIDQLEDHISKGEDFAILPSPAESRILPDDTGIYDSTLVQDQWQELIVNEQKNKRLRSYLTETETVNVLKHIHRTSRTALEENGANSLFLALGILKWYETDRSTKPRYAPILMIPVDLIRHGGNRYVIRSRDEDTIINVTLIEMVKQQFQLSMPGLSPLPADSNGVDVRKVLAVMRSCIMTRPRWDILDEAMLGLFSFSKFVMWNDIHNIADKMAAHPVIQALANNQVVDLSGNDLPPVDARELDITTAPTEFAVPVDVDSSQFEAIVESGRGKSFVLHGPPGTGKSQTITNMIANALFQGKKVLFVAEKMAALEVVQKRLKAIGIAPFCLELHSNKATKTHVLQQLDKALNTIERGASKEYQTTARKLWREREQISHYVSALHARQSSGLSLYECITIFLDIDGEELATTGLMVDDMTTETIAQNEEIILSLGSVLQLTGAPGQHPLNGLVVNSATDDALSGTAQQLKQYSERLQRMRDDAQEINKAIGLTLGQRPSEYRVLGCLCQALQQVKFMTRPMLEAAGNPQMQRLISHIDNGLVRKQLKEAVEADFLESAYALDAEQLQQQWNEISNQWWLARSINKYKFKKNLKPYLLSTDEIDVDRLLGVLIDYQAQDARCDQTWQSELNQAFGAAVDKDSADWLAMRDLLNRAEALYAAIGGFCSGKMKSTVVNSIAASAAADPAIFERNQSLWVRVAADYNRLLEAQNKLAEYCSFDDPDGENHEQMAASMATQVENLGRDWKQWTDRRAVMRQNHLEDAVCAISAGMQPRQVADAWKKAVYHAMASSIMAKDERLTAFSGTIFEDTIVKFRQLDKRFQELTKLELFNRLARNLREHTSTPGLYSQMGYLRRNIANRGRGQSVRNIMDQVGELLPYLCPCLLMSPISVAQYLALNQQPYDLVIFDEASQMPTSEAIGAIARGKALIVVGDPKQMPPTNFFNVNQVDESEEAIDDLDSVLDDTIALDFPSKHLRWHYRSRHESLIAFSNSQYYDGRLITFPSVDDRDTKVTFVPIEGVYDYGRSRSNKAEAAAIVNEVLRRLRDKKLRDRSIGIVSFSIAQQNLIDDMLVDAFAQFPELEQAAIDREEPIFIKNLENVQGDERDVILFSIGYGPDARGKVSMNFGPLNNQGGERRLNVAVSRARYEMMVFSTLQPEQIDLNRSKSLGVQGLKMFLEYARDGRVGYQNNQPQVQINVMARKLAEILKEKGYKVATAVGRSKFKIDLAVIDPNDPGRYLLGVLCDGKGYSDTKTVRDREVCQPEVLRALGWNIVRVWMLDWYYDRERVVKQVLEALKAVENHPSRVDSKRTEVTPRQVSNVASYNQNQGNINDTKPVKTEAEKPQTNGSDKVVEIADEPRKQSVQRPATPPRVVAPRVPKKDESNQVKIDESLLPEPTEVPYVEADIPIEDKGGVMMLTTRPTKTMAQMKQILQHEQPITFHYACKRMCRIWAVRNINERVTKFVTWLLKQTATLDDDAPAVVPYYWANAQARSAYRSYRLKGGREWHDIPLIEVKNAILAILYKQRKVTEADMPQKVIDLFGIKKCGTLFREQVSIALTQLVRDNQIHHTDNIYTPRRRSRRKTDD